MSNGYPAKMWNLLKSKTLAAALIFILAVVSALGMLVPRLAVFQTRWFAVLGVVFLLNLTACSCQQLINALRFWQNRHRLIKKETNTEVLPVDKDQVIKSFAGVIRKRRYQEVSGTPGKLLWTKQNFGIWGAGIFHVGLILITIGALVSGATKMSGYMKIAEGEVRSEQHENYEALEEGPFFREAWHTGTGIMLNKQRVEVNQNGDIENVISDIQIMKEGEPVRAVSLGEKDSVIDEGLRIFEKNSGFAPYLEIAGPARTTILQTYLLLETDNTVTPERFYLKGFRLPNTKYTINIEFYPDMVLQGSRITTNKLILTNPAAVIELMEADRKIAESVIRPGQAVDLQGYKVKMDEVRQWSGFDIVDDRGANYVFGGSWVALGGLTLMYLFPYKKIQLYSEGIGNRDWKLIGITNRPRKIFDEELQELRTHLDNLIHDV